MNLLFRYGLDISQSHSSCFRIYPWANWTGAAKVSLAVKKERAKMWKHFDFSHWPLDEACGAAGFVSVPCRFSACCSLERKTWALFHVNVFNGTLKVYRLCCSYPLLGNTFYQIFYEFAHAGTLQVVWGWTIGPKWGTSPSACKCCINTPILSSQQCIISTHLLSFQTREPDLLPRMRRIRRSGWESAACWLQLTERLINLNATISGTTSISPRLSRRLFISLSEIGWRICERLVGGRKPAALVPSGGTDVPGTIRVFRGKKKKKKKFTMSKVNEAVYAGVETQTFSSDIMTQILPACNCWRPAGCCNCPLFHLDAAAQRRRIIAVL